MCARWHRRGSGAALSTNPSRSLVAGPPVRPLHAHTPGPAAAMLEGMSAAGLRRFSADPHFLLATGSLPREKFHRAHDGIRAKRWSPEHLWREWPARTAEMPTRYLRGENYIEKDFSSRSRRTRYFQ